MRSVRTLVVALAMLASLGTARASTQDATPMPAGVGGEIPDPAACQVAPRSTDELITLWYPENEAGTPVLATPEAPTRTSVPVPLGRPADATTAEEVTASVHEVLACFNAGDLRRALALYTDSVVWQFHPGPEETVEEVRSMLELPVEPVPAADRTRLFAVTDVSVVADGRVAAFVVFDDPTLSPAGPETILVYFVEGDDGWLADEFVSFTAFAG